MFCVDVFCFVSQPIGPVLDLHGMCTHHTPLQIAAFIDLAIAWTNAPTQARVIHGFLLLVGGMLNAAAIMSEVIAVRYLGVCALVRVRGICGVRSLNTRVRGLCL